MGLERPPLSLGFQVEIESWVRGACVLLFRAVRAVPGILTGGSTSSPQPRANRADGRRQREGADLCGTLPGPPAWLCRGASKTLLRHARFLRGPSCPGCQRAPRGSGRSQGSVFLLRVSGTAGRGPPDSPCRRPPPPAPRRAHAEPGSLGASPGAQTPWRAATAGSGSCVGLRKFPRGLHLSLWLFITLGGRIVSGSGEGGGGRAAGVPETDSLKGKRILSCISRRDFLRGVGHPAFRSLGAGWDLGALSPGARQALAHSVLPGEPSPLPVTILVSCHSEFFPVCCSSFGLVKETVSHGFHLLPGASLSGKGLAVSITMAGKSVHRNERPSAAAICSPSVPPLPLSFLGAWDLMTSSGLLASALLGKERGL